MKRKLLPLPCSKGLRATVDYWHERLDGRFVIPDRLAVFMVGVLGALIPPLVLYLIAKGGA